MTRLEWVLRKAVSSSSIVGGIVTNGGVASTVRDAHVRDFDITVLADGCAAFSRETHETAIAALRPLCPVSRSPRPSPSSAPHERRKPPASPFESDLPVVIVGAGAAGLCAALAAHEAGAECAVLERDALPRGSTALSAGLIPAAGTRFQRERGIADDAERFAADIHAQGQD